MALARKVVAEVRSLWRSLLHRLDIVFAIPPGAIEVFVQHLGRGRLQRGHDKAGVIARLMTSALRTTRHGCAQDAAA